MAGGRPAGGRRLSGRLAWNSGPPIHGWPGQRRKLVMTSTVFIVNDAPYGSERPYNALRLAGALAAREGQQVRVFLLADAVACARAGQKIPEGYYNVALM